MNSRERLIKTLNHEETDEIVVDMGSSLISGISAVALDNLRNALGLEKRIIKVNDPFQLLGEVEEDVRKALNIDVVGVSNPYNMFGYKNEGWKKWTTPRGLNVMMGEGFKTTVDENGTTYVYPKGDINSRPSAKIPKDGYYFDAIVRQAKINEDNLDGRKDFKEDFSQLSDDALKHIEKQVNYYYNNTDYGINLGNPICGLGDFATIPGPSILNPEGIRNIEEWMMAHYLHPEYIKEIFEYQVEIALKNLKLLKEAAGNKAQVIQISGTDFGTQKGEIMSPDTFREFYKPYYTKINKWVHENTNWKTFYHTCGSIVQLLDDFADMGVDILNPVQCSAEGMNPTFLKENYGDKFVFWGGSVDTQKTLPFGTPEEVKAEVLERLTIFSKNGGFVFNTIHNIQAPTPIQNILAMFEAIKEFNQSKKR